MPNENSSHIFCSGTYKCKIDRNSVALKLMLQRSAATFDRNFSNIEGIVPNEPWMWKVKSVETIQNYGKCAIRGMYLWGIRCRNVSVLASSNGVKRPIGIDQAHIFLTNYFFLFVLIMEFRDHVIGGINYFLLPEIIIGKIINISVSINNGKSHISTHLVLLRICLEISTKKILYFF